MDYHAKRGFFDMNWEQKMSVLDLSFQYIKRGIGLMNHPDETHSFTPEKVKQETESLIAKAQLLVIALEDEIAKTQKS